MNKRQWKKHLKKKRLWLNNNKLFKVLTNLILKEAVEKVGDI